MANKQLSALNGILKRLLDIGNGEHAEVVAIARLGADGLTATSTMTSSILAIVLSVITFQ